MSIHYDEKGKIFTNVVSKNAILATIQTHTHRINGYIYVREGNRIKDELDQPQQFLAVTDAVVYDPAGKIIYECNFMTINRGQIIWLIPDDEISPGSDQPGGDGGETK